MLQGKIKKKRMGRAMSIKLGSAFLDCLQTKEEVAVMNNMIKATSMSFSIMKRSIFNFWIWRKAKIRKLHI